jgi:murein DD-endopeptidase MepM/ murein hydrolase activator NlpD
VDTLRDKYKALQRENNQKQEQLASLQVMASEVSMALGLRQSLEGTEDITTEGAQMPGYKESLEQYDFLKSASFSRVQHQYAHAWQKDIVPSLWPVNGKILSRFGDRQDPFSGEGEIHTGVDISAPSGTVVVAAADGVISHAEFAAGGYGKLVIIDHGNGMTTWYAHLSSFEVLPGQEIRRGQALGHSGATGRVTAPHLHYEIRVGHAAVNPYPYLTKSVMLQKVRPDLPF